jgi:hypothetical protein
VINPMGIEIPVGEDASMLEYLIEGKFLLT